MGRSANAILACDGLIQFAALTGAAHSQKDETLKHNARY